MLKQRAPGPGAYEPGDGISAKGRYFLSTMQSSKAPHFLKGPRDTSTSPSRVSTPGPGSYRVPSDFGYGQEESIEEKANKTMALSFYAQASRNLRNNTTFQMRARKGLSTNKSVPEFRVIKQ